MRFFTLLNDYVDERIKQNPEAAAAIEEFRRNIPGRIILMEFDSSRTHKDGIKDGDKVYKLGFDKDNATVFIQYYENCNQGQPTMALFTERDKALLTISGTKVEQRFYMRFAIVDGEVKKSVQYVK